jgi:hypothetical protein
MSIQSEFLKQNYLLYLNRKTKIVTACVIKSKLDFILKRAHQSYKILGSGRFNALEAFSLASLADEK